MWEGTGYEISSVIPLTLHCPFTMLVALTARHAGFLAAIAGLWYCNWTESFPWDPDDWDPGILRHITELHIILYKQNVQLLRATFILFQLHHAARMCSSLP